VADIELLNQRDRNFSPDLDHPGYQARFFEAEAFVEAYGEGDRFLGIGRFERSQVGVLQRQSQLVASARVEVDAEYHQQIVEFRAVDYAEAVKLVNAGNRTLVFELGEPGVGDIEFFVLLVLRNRTAELFHLTRSNTQSIAEFPELIACTHLLRHQ